MEEVKLSFPQKLVQMIESQSHDQLLFILFGGIILTAVVLGLVLFATRNQKSPHES